jgi:hypothetical protein
MHVRMCGMRPGLGVGAVASAVGAGGWLSSEFGVARRISDICGGMQHARLWVAAGMNQLLIKAVCSFITILQRLAFQYTCVCSTTIKSDHYH